MTKAEFLNGTPFTIGQSTYKGDSTFYYDNGCISRQVRSSIDQRVILDTYECRITTIGRLHFEGFNYILRKKVNVKYKFSDLVEFKQEA